MIKKLYAFVVLISLSVALNAHAILLCQDVVLQKPMFGLEFTFTNDQIIQEASHHPNVAEFSNLKVKREYWKNLEENIKLKCQASGDCVIKMMMDKHGLAFVVVFKDGFKFSVGSDAKVLEANAEPNTILGYKLVLDRLDQYLFQSAREVGLSPHQSLGGGHIHVSRRAFRENTFAFRNFFVDFQNRPEIGLGVFGKSYQNAPMLSILKPQMRTALEKVLKKFSQNKKTSLDDFVNMIRNEVYTESYVPEWGGVTHYQALNINRMNWDNQLATIEIRSFRPQKNVEIFYKQIQLLNRWIEKTHEVHYEIPYLSPKIQKEYTESEKRIAFETLLKSLGLPLEDYLVLLE